MRFNGSVDASEKDTFTELILGNPLCLRISVREQSTQLRNERHIPLDTQIGVFFYN